MAERLKLGPLLDDKPVKATVEFPAAVWRDLQAYADAMARGAGSTAADPAKLVVPMVERFMAADRAFTRVRRGGRAPG